MFIGLARYGGKGTSDCFYEKLDSNVKIAVMDTGDGTVESATVRELMQAGVVLENCYVTDTSFTVQNISCMHRLNMLSSEYVRLLDISGSGFSSFGLGFGNRIYRISTMFNDIKVNSQCVFTGCDKVEFSYIFKLDNYTIMRFFDRGTCIWYSIAFDVYNNIIAYWDNKFNIAYNKVLALKIDMVSEV